MINVADDSNPEPLDILDREEKLKWWMKAYGNDEWNLLMNIHTTHPNQRVGQ